MDTKPLRVGGVGDDDMMRRRIRKSSRHRRATVLVAIDPRTGLLLRRATVNEAAAYWRGNKGRAAPFRSRSFDKPVLVGKVLIDTHTGPAVWFGGAGF
jgi:hypothetical protein